ncbi:hypothetical protein INT47_004637, partial [Mucor saturninus]
MIDAKENPAACIFVASLNKNVSDEDLNDSVFVHFNQWGPLLGVKVLKDSLKRPYAFVQFEFEDDCKTALKEAPGTIINGRSIRCEPARVNRSICLISFNQPFNRQFLQSKLSMFGEIEDITLLQPQGNFHYVYVKYMYRKDAIKSYLALKYNNANHWFVEWTSNVETSMYGGVYQYATRCLDRFSIFIGNLHESTSDADLSLKFKLYGTIVQTHVIRKNPRKVFAFIRFKEEEAALKAIHSENGNIWNERILRVNYREYYHNPCAYGHYQNKNIKPIMMVPYYNSAYDPYYMVNESLGNNMTVGGTFYKDMNAPPYYISGDM